MLENNKEANKIDYTKQLRREAEQRIEVIITAKVLRLKLVRIIDILKGNILSPTIMADKILLKTIKVTVSDCFIYIPNITKLFFKPLPLPLTEPY